LILAHQFDDKFEWFLMQLSKGAGLKELFGMSELEKRKGKTDKAGTLKASDLAQILKQSGYAYEQLIASASKLLGD